MWICRWKYSLSNTSSRFLVASGGSVSLSWGRQNRFFRFPESLHRIPMGSVFPYTEVEKRQFNTGAEWGRTLIHGKKSAFTEKQVSILDLLRESRVPPLKQLLSASLPWQPATLGRIRSLPQLVATFSFILMGGNGASCCVTSRMARRKSARQCASPSSFGRKAREGGSPWLHDTQRPRAGGGSPRRWRVHKAGASTAYQVTSTSTAVGNAFQAVEVGSEGKGSACVKLGSFLHYAKPWCQDAQSWAKIQPTNSSD